MKNPFFLLSEGIYRKLISVTGKEKNQRICRMLSCLYPSGDIDRLYDDFQIKRLASVLGILAIGIVSAGVLSLCSSQEIHLAEGAHLSRKEWDAGNYRVTLRANVEDWSQEIPFLVEERMLSDEEREEMLDRLREVLPELIRGENQDLEHVTEDLNLRSGLAGYPFQLSWSSSNSEILDGSGRINRRNIGEKGEKITLRAKVSGAEESVEFMYEVILFPEELDEKDLFFRQLEDVLAELNLLYRDQKQIPLPRELSGKSISWEEKSSDSSAGIILLGLICSVLVCAGMENDMERSCRKRDRQLAVYYPDFVSKLRLYLSAGLTVKNAFVRITSDYGNAGSRKRGEKHYLCEEMKVACFQLENGVREEQVYRDLGRRCEEMCYRRLCFLLSVQLKRGNDQLLVLLAEEADNALRERRNMAKRAGEEAGTKLLFPMMLMLVLVMVLILLPAYINFGTI